MSKLRFTGERVVPGDMPDHVHVLQEHLARYVFALGHIKPGDRVLDAACGTGYGCMMLSWGLADEPCGVDVDAATIAFAQVYFGYAANFGVFDITEDYAPEGAPFDVMVSFETVEHVDPDAYIRFVREAVCADGKLIVSTPLNPARQPQNPNHKFEWDAAEFVAWLGDNFESYSLFGQRGHNIEPVQDGTLDAKIAAMAEYNYGIAVCKGVKT